MRCTHCKRIVHKSETLHFCPYCGKPIKNVGKHRITTYMLISIILFACAVGCILLFFSRNRLSLFPFIPEDGPFSVEKSPSKDEYQRDQSLILDVDSGIYDLYGLEYKAENADEVSRVLESYSSFFGIDYCCSDLKLSNTSLVLDDTFYKYQQYYNDIPVYGKCVIVTVGSDHNISMLVNNTIDCTGIDTTINEESFRIGCNLLNLSEEEGRKYCALYLYHYKDNIVPAYVFILSSGDLYIISAKDGSIIKHSQGFNTIGMESKQLDGQSEKRTIDILDDNGTYYLKDTNRKITVYDSTNVTNNTALPFDDVFKQSSLIALSQNNSINYKSAIDALFNIQRTYDFYKNQLHHISSDGKGQIDIRIFDGFKKYLTKDNKEKSFTDNAAAWGRPNKKTTELMIGVRSGGQATYSNNLDVLGHEFTHSVMHYIISDEFTNAEGEALGEGLSDIMGLMIEAYYNDNKCDWYMADLRDYSSEQSTLSSYQQYNDTLDCHDGGTIICSIARNIWNGNSANSAISPINDPVLMAELWYRTICAIDIDLDYAKCRNLCEISALNMVRKGKISSQQLNCIVWALDQAKVSSKLMSGISNTGLSNINSFPADTDLVPIIYDVSNDIIKEYHLTVYDAWGNQVFDSDGDSDLSINLPEGVYSLLVKSKSEDMTYRAKISTTTVDRLKALELVRNGKNKIELHTNIHITQNDLPQNSFDEATLKNMDPIAEAVIYHCIEGEIDSWIPDSSNLEYYWDVMCFYSNFSNYNEDSTIDYSQKDNYYIVPDQILKNASYACFKDFNGIIPRIDTDIWRAAYNDSNSKLLIIGDSGIKDFKLESYTCNEDNSVDAIYSVLFWGEEDDEPSNYYKIHYLTNSHNNMTSQESIYHFTVDSVSISNNIDTIDTFGEETQEDLLQWNEDVLTGWAGAGRLETLKYDDAEKELKYLLQTYGKGKVNVKGTYEIVSDFDIWEENDGYSSTFSMASHAFRTENQSDLGLVYAASGDYNGDGIADIISFRTEEETDDNGGCWINWYGQLDQCGKKPSSFIFSDSMNDESDVSFLLANHYLIKINRKYEGGNVWPISEKEIDDYDLTFYETIEVQDLDDSAKIVFSSTREVGNYFPDDYNYQLELPGNRYYWNIDYSTSDNVALHEISDESDIIRIIEEKLEDLVGEHVLSLSPLRWENRWSAMTFSNPASVLQIKMSVEPADIEDMEADNKKVGSGSFSIKTSVPSGSIE